MWMSLARSCTASVMIRLTSLTTGASDWSSSSWLRLLLDGGFGEVDRGVGELLEHRVGTLAVGEAVVAVDRLHDLLAGCDRHLDLAIEDEAKLLLGVHVGRVAGGDPQGAA